MQTERQNKNKDKPGTVEPETITAAYEKAAIAFEKLQLVAAVAVAVDLGY